MIYSQLYKMSSYFSRISSKKHITKICLTGAYTESNLVYRIEIEVNLYVSVAVC